MGGGREAAGCDQDMRIHKQATVCIACIRTRRTHARRVAGGMLAAAALPPFGAVLLSNSPQRLSVCVAFKAGSTQWRLLFSALSAQQQGNIGATLRPEQFGRDEIVPGQRHWPPETETFVWQPFYNRTADASWRHVHVIRDPLERTVSAYLDRCVHLDNSDACQHESLVSSIDSTSRNWTASKADVHEFVSRLPRARAWFIKRGEVPFQSSIDQHFQAQMLRCANYGITHRRDEHQWFFNSTIAWTDSSGLAHPARAVCFERNIAPELCDAAFPVTSHAMHATGAATLLQRLFSSEEVRELRAKVYDAYAKDALTYERYRKAAAPWMRSAP